jgi:anti-sigma regulatory factor (Ser/Thr protein kinase)
MDVTIPMDRRAPGVARHALDGLAEWVPEEDLERFQLAVSELVTNAIEHTAGRPHPADLRLVVRVKPDRLSTSVIQPGQGFEKHVHKPDPQQESGWGLYLVDQVADRWGIDSQGETRVWAEFVLSPQDDSGGRSSTTPVPRRQG